MEHHLANIIVALRRDSGGQAFTGFITDACVTHSPFLVGRVWCHVRAEPSGRFADGHRISTSGVEEVHFAGDSVWVVTESGSVYGILTFAPGGRHWFDELRRIGDDRPYSPLCVVHGETYFPARSIAPQDARPFGAAKRAMYGAGAARASGSEGRNPFRPPPNDYVNQMKAHHEKAIAALRKRGVRTAHHRSPDEPKDGDE